MKTTTESTSKTRTDSSVVKGLNQLLADSYALMANTHYAHWNVEGEGFFSLHKAFEEQYESLFAAVDEVAERVRALDAYAMGGLRNFSSESGIDELKTPAAAKDFVAALVVAHEKAIADAVTLRDAAGNADDLETQDLAIGRIQWHQKTAWMLKSYLK
ncbi:DNA starvation/stationary phase protection protein [Opitutus sp. ER46]|uniref:Dps family protein n=1 Tax=Opitutus sp. ER46 TaxID=2161864 RepID=UPI000D30E2B4|nr:DNA starvation/stationary phase protection protein [Opitutus sp. ER46]PTX92679.1 DNA starvation/stationary phase protection protein [Opitutus sp. ER46]